MSLYWIGFLFCLCYQFLQVVHIKEIGMGLLVVRILSVALTLLEKIHRGLYGTSVQPVNNYRQITDVLNKYGLHT